MRGDTIKLAIRLRGDVDNGKNLTVPTAILTILENKVVAHPL
jgi:hypothetical protein